MPEPLPSSSFSLRHEFTLYRLPNCMTAPIITPMGFQYANFEIINIMSAHLLSFDYLIAPSNGPALCFTFLIQVRETVLVIGRNNKIKS